MLSFDVKSLFPSISISQTLVFLKKWLLSSKIDEQKCNMNIDLAKICMDQNIFQFNGKFNFQNKGTAMGNSLSGFLAEIFMNFFDTEFKDHPLFPRIRYQYVDDVFAICSCRKINATLDLINKCYDSIKFTCERECDNK